MTAPSPPTQGNCNCWLVTAVAYGFTGFNPVAQARQIASWGLINPPCSAAADDVSLTSPIKWNGECTMLESSVALRILCK